MRLADLDPRWLLKDGRRIGLIFLSPTGPWGYTPWRQTCFFEQTPFREQCEAVWDACDDLKRPAQQHFGKFQTCDQQCAWTVAGGVESATFDTLTITPSIDGSQAGLWHGFITNGEAR